MFLFLNIFCLKYVNCSIILAQNLLQVLFQYAARHAPMNISDIIATVSAPDDDDDDDDDKDSQMHESM